MFTIITVTGGPFVRSDGSPMTGTGTATLSHRIANGTSISEPAPIEGQLSTAGLWVNMSGLAFALIAVDDTGTAPTGSFYTFALSFDDAPLDPFDAVISHLASGGTVDLSALIPSLP